MAIFNQGTSLMTEAVRLLEELLELRFEDDIPQGYMIVSGQTCPPSRASMLM